MVEYKIPTGLISDVTFDLMAEDVEASCGLALDIGSTIGKIVYRSRKEYKEGKPIKPQDDVTKGVAHYAMFPRTDIDGMINYINENADLMRNAEGELLVRSAGVGGAAFKTTLKNGLNCKLQVLSEGDCFANALIAMEKAFSNEELCIPNSAALAEFAQASKEKYEIMIKKMSEMTAMKMPELSAEGVKMEDRPRILVMSGSGTGIFQIFPDGSYSFLSMLGVAGRSMYGLASILTAENDFNKLVVLAEKGDGMSTDTWTDDLLGEVGQGNNESGENIYETGFGQENMSVFPFGKGVLIKQDDMTKEDLAYSTFRTIALIHSQMVMLCTQISKAKAVYFAGNMFNTELIRDLVSRNLLEMLAFMPEESKFELNYLRNGGMFGALGAFLIQKKSE